MPQDPEAARALSLVHGQVCYLQLPAANSKRAAAFYEAVFGWDIGTPSAWQGADHTPQQ